MKMKKKKRTVAVLISVFASFALAITVMNALGFGATGYFTEMPDVSELDAEQLAAVKKAYVDMKKERLVLPEDVTEDRAQIVQYCGIGSRGDCVAAMLDCGEVFTQAVEFETVAGVVFRYNDANRIYAFRDGKAYTLGQAYSNGFLNAKDLQRIRDVHNKY